MHDERSTSAAPGLDGRGVAIQALGTLPALAAITAGILYATGALVRTAELRGAGLTVRDTFTLIPIEQHLARGIEVAFEPTTLAVFALVALALILLQLEQGETESRTRGRNRSRALDSPAFRLLDWLNDRVGLRWTAGIGFLPVVVPLSAICIFRPVLGVAMVVALAPLWSSTNRIFRFVRTGELTPVESPGFPRQTTLLAALLLGLGVMAALSALLTPEPLALATFTTNKARVSGGVIATTDQGWYLDVPETREYRFIPSRQIRSVELRSRSLPDQDRAQQKTLFDLIEGDF